MKNYKAVYYLVRAGWGRWRWKLRGVYEKNADTAKMLHCLHNKERKLAYSANIYLAPLFSRSYLRDIFGYPGCQLKSIDTFPSIEITRKLINTAVALERGDIPVNPMDYGYYWFEHETWEFRQLERQRKQAYQRKQQQLARCRSCRYYHESEYLKCAVNPLIPLDCSDFE